MMAALANWWAMNGPLALNEHAHGPMRRSDKVVFIITAGLGLYLFFYLFTMFYVMGGQ